MQLSEHFTLEEFVRSETATRNKIDNSPPDLLIPNLKHLACLLELIRARINWLYKEDKVVWITSGYRCPRLNAAVGGVDNSQHMLGEAADFVVPGSDIEDIYQIIKEMDCAVMDQCINEYGQWIHISTVIPKVNRHQYFYGESK